MCHWAVANQAGMFERKLIEKLLANQRLSDLVVMEREGLPQTLQKKPPVRSHSWWQERWTPRRSRSNFWDVNISFNPGLSQNSELSGNAKEKGLEVIKMVYWITQIDPDGWLDADAWFIKEMNYVLDRSDFEEQIVKTILKENIFEHKYNQAKYLTMRGYIADNTKTELWGYKDQGVGSN